jgi:hypothetical protein
MAKLSSEKAEGLIVSGRITPTDLNGARLVWRKAQLSTNNGACVEVASVVGKVALRDSKDPSGPILVYTPEEWGAFLDGAKKGEFDDLAS